LRDRLSDHREGLGLEALLEDVEVVGMDALVFLELKLLV